MELFFLKIVGILPQLNDSIVSSKKCEIIANKTRWKKENAE
jgi:hypothetical protein